MKCQLSKYIITTGFKMKLIGQTFDTRVKETKFFERVNKTRQIKLIPSNSLISPYILHTLEKNPLDQSHPLTRHRLITTLYHFSLSFPLSIRSKSLTFPLISPRDSSTLTHDSIPIFLYSFLLRHYRPSSFLSHRLSTLVAIPRFHPRDNLSPRYTIYLRIRLSFFIIRLHPPLRLSLGAPFFVSQRSGTRRITYRPRVTVYTSPPVQSFGLFTSILDFIWRRDVECIRGE